jgi:hypothetical protein
VHVAHAAHHLGHLGQETHVAGLFRRLRSRRRAVPQQPDAGVLPAVLGCLAVDPATLQHLTTAQLCSLWRKSAAGLSAATTPGALAEVVNARAVVLAELERRDPVAMAAWIAAGAREAGGPPSYLLGTTSSGSRER